MTQFLIRRFIRHPNDPQDPATRTAYGNLASGVGMACNLLLCLGKLLAGTLFGSIAIMADALNNLSDASSNVVSLIGFRLAAKAPDAEHPYGHARYEYLAGLVVSVTILGIGFSLLKESVVKVFHPTPVAFSWLSVGVLAASILVKLWMSGFNRTIGRTIGLLLTRKAVNATVTLCHTGTKDVREHMRRADVIVAAMGVAGFVKPEDIKEGSILVDVGVSRVFDEESGRYKVKGDVDKACYEKALAYTPNPGGVGPMTRAMLLQNVVEMAERQL